MQNPAALGRIGPLHICSEVCDDEGNEIGYEQIQIGASVSDHRPGHKGLVVRVDPLPENPSVAYFWVQWGTEE